LGGWLRSGLCCGPIAVVSPLISQLELA